MKKTVLWAISAVLVLAVGMVLHAARGPLTSALEGVPDMAPPPLPPPPPPPPEPEPPPPPPVVALLTDAEVETLLEAMPAKLLELTQSGLVEIEDYEDLGSEDPNKASRAQRLWDIWAKTWLNRLRELRKEIPSAEEMTFHAAQKPAQDFSMRVIGILAKLPEATTVEDARTRLEGVQARIEEYLTPPPPEEEEGVEGEGVEGEGVEGEGVEGEGVEASVEGGGGV